MIERLHLLPTNESLGRNVPLLVNSALAALIVWQGWQLIAPLTDNRRELVSEQGEVAVTSSAGVEVGSSSRWHLFGQRSSAGPAVAPIVPKSNLRLALRGTITGPQPDRGRAIIADADGQEYAYEVGDELPGGANLHEVYRDRVVLRRGARLETLELSSEIGAGSSRRKGAQKSALAARPAQGTIVSADTNTNWAKVRERLRGDPSSLAKNITAIPVRVRGQIVGYSLRPGRDATLFRKLGLKPTDVITAVNGRTVTDPGQSMAILEELQSASQLSVSLKREGHELTLPIDLSQ